jgi:hypothetical protein
MAFTLLAAAACTGDDLPPPGGGGGGGTGGGGQVDGGSQPGGDAGGRLVGTLCAALDLRAPLACPAVDLAGIPVEPAAGGPGDVSDADGDFALDLPADSNVLLRVGADAAAVRDSLAATGEWSDVEGLAIPTVRQDDWDDLLAIIGAVEPDGTASILLYIRDQAGPVTGAEVLIDGTSQPPYYDDGGATSWDQIGPTGAHGAALIVSAPAISPTVPITVVVDGTPYSGSVQVRPDHLTFARTFLSAGN